MEKILVTVVAISSISGVLALLLSIANRTIANYGEMKIIINEEKEINFKPGQYVQILTPTYKGSDEEVYRAYSVASSPSNKDNIELFVGKVPDGICTTFIHEHLKEQDQLTIVGPFGDFSYQHNERDMIMGAIGTGMAPILSIIRYMYEEKIDRKCIFFFSARTRKDLFMLDELLKYESEMPNLTLKLSLTRPTPECNWDGEVGRIPEMMEKHIDDASQTESYLCGSPIMIEAVTKVLLAKGMPEEHIYFDNFS